jgi:bifunctional DNase/RNase
MIPVTMEGVRRNFTSSSVFLYSVFLLEETSQRLLIFGIERDEALPIVAALHHLSLPRPPTIQLLAETLTALNATLRTAESIHEQALQLRPGDVAGLALFLHAPLLVATDLCDQLAISLADGQTPEMLVAHFVLRQAGITVPPDVSLRFGFSKTPSRDALVKEFKAALLGKAPIFPEADMEQRKHDYIAFLLRNT